MRLKPSSFAVFFVIWSGLGKAVVYCSICTRSLMSCVCVSSTDVYFRCSFLWFAQRNNAEKFALTFNDYGRHPPTFGDASFVAQQLLESSVQFKNGTIFYNKFKSVIAFKSSQMHFLSHASLSEAGKICVLTVALCLSFLGQTLLL